MNSINLVDPNIGKKQLSIKTSVNHEVDDGNKGFLSSTVDTVTLASKVGARKIVSSYETVQFSKLVPKQLPAKKLETADILSKKINNGELLSFKEESSIREDRVLAAIVGMRFMQNLECDLCRIMSIILISVGLGGSILRQMLNWMRLIED